MKQLKIYKITEKSCFLRLLAVIVLLSGKKVGVSIHSDMTAENHNDPSTDDGIDHLQNKPSPGMNNVLKSEEWYLYL